MKKQDIFLILGFVAAAVVAFFIVSAQAKAGAKAQVLVDGKIVNEYDLNKDGSYKIETENDGLNVLIIENGVAYVVDANCPDKICEKQGKISKSGESIICLPHKVVVTIVDDKNQAETDAIAG